MSAADRTSASRGTPLTRETPMHALLLGASGAVGTIIRRELEREGHRVTTASRRAAPAAEAAAGQARSARVDLTGDLGPLAALAETHDVVINASGIERADLAGATGATPLVDISATGSYLQALKAAARGPVVLGAGLVPGLSTVLVSALEQRPGDELDVLVMLGAGEQHGPAAVAWTAGLVGTDVFQPPEGGRVRNLAESLRAKGPDGRTRRYLRADFPDHIIAVSGRAGRGGASAAIRSYLTLSSWPMTAALRVIGRAKGLSGVLGMAPHVGSDAWHVVARNRRTGERLEAEGSGQSEATGRLTALAAVRAAERAPFGAVSMAELVTQEEARQVLRRA